MTQIPIRWSALGWHHLTWLPLSAGSSFLPLVTCPPKAALSYVDRSSDRR
jgi:hypothetical protein